MTELVETEVQDFSTRLVRRFLLMCESPRTRDRMMRLVRGSTGSARAGRVLYRAINRTVVTPAARAAGIQATAVTWELVASQLIGLAMLRYVLEVEPVASLPVEELVRQTAPAVRAVLRS